MPAMVQSKAAKLVSPTIENQDMEALDRFTGSFPNRAVSPT